MSRIIKKYKKKFGSSVEVVSFNPVDFLEEGVEDFFESGSKSEKLVSSLIKIAIATELILKDALREINPALILENIDVDGSQIIRVFELENKLLSPILQKDTNLKTASLRVLLKRAQNFFDINKNVQGVLELNSLRNDLIHYEKDVDVHKVNFLIVKKILPFLCVFLKQYEQRGLSLKQNSYSFPFFSLNKKLWEKVKRLEHKVQDIFQMELHKKIAHYLNRFEQLATEDVDYKPKQPLVRKNKKEVVTHDLIPCPACKYKSSSLIVGLDADWNPDGTLFFSYYFIQCRVCGMELDEDEIELISSDPTHFLETKGDITEWGGLYKKIKHNRSPDHSYNLEELELLGIM